MDTTRNPRLLEHAQHTYDDKYILAALLTNTSLAAQICALEQLGLDGKNLVKVCNWVHKDKHNVQNVELVNINPSLLMMLKY